MIHSESRAKPRTILGPPPGHPWNLRTPVKPCSGLPWAGTDTMESILWANPRNEMSMVAPIEPAEEIYRVRHANRPCIGMVMNVCDALFREGRYVRHVQFPLTPPQVLTLRLYVLRLALFSSQASAAYMPL